MVKYTIGDIIRRERKNQKLSQEVLCDGICTPSWLSKIESGACIPTPTLFEALMQRLGKNHSYYVTYLSEMDMRIEQLKIEIRRHYALLNLPSAVSLYDELKVLVREDHPSDRQFLILYDVLLFQKTQLSHDKLLELLNEAIELTHEKFDIQRLDQYLLTQDDIVIINNIAISLKESNNMPLAINVLKNLRQYLENPRFDYEEKYRTYPLIMYNLAKWQHIGNDFIGCLSTCEAAIDFCIQYNRLSIFPDLIYYKGCAFMGLGVESPAIKCFKEAYYIFSASKNQEFADLVIKSCEKNYHLILLE